MLKSKCVLVYGLSEEEIEKLKKINFKVIKIEKNMSSMKIKDILNKKEVIDEEILQNALNDILKYFSNFNCRLKKRIFWYYLENSNKIVEVKKEKYYNLYVLIKR